VPVVIESIDSPLSIRRHQVPCGDVGRAARLMDQGKPVIFGDDEDGFVLSLE
jgi:hypothetical protein